MKSRFFTVIISLLVSIIVIIILSLIFVSLSDKPDENKVALRLITLLGGDLPLGVIQGFTYFLFVFAFLEIINLNKSFALQERAFDKHLLPEKENWVLSPSDVVQLRLNIMEHEKYDKTILGKIIIQVCSKYRVNKSTSEAMDFLSSLVKINKENDDSNLSLVRYALWAIPSVGFIGTVIGIAQSLGSVKQNMTSDDLTAVTSALNVAFDTTLLALFLSIILMYMYHRIQERIEKFHIRTEQYILENLINRIYHS